MRISDWSSDVCSSDLTAPLHPATPRRERHFAVVRGDEGGARPQVEIGHPLADQRPGRTRLPPPPSQPRARARGVQGSRSGEPGGAGARKCRADAQERSEEHTFEPQSLMSISNAVFCMEQKRATE